jgi:predicted DNA-binding transcriptional regulator YafY
VDPLGLVAKGMSWYLFARTPHGFRTYRVSRMTEAKLLDAASERPANFDLAAAWNASTQEFREGRRGYEAVLRFDSRAAEWVRTWQTASVVGEQADGWVTMRVRFHHEEEACFVVHGLGTRAEVIAPSTLRKRVAQEIAEVAARYA